MRSKLRIWLLVIVVLSGCKEEEPIMEAPETSGAATLFEGSFESDAHPTIGSVKVTSDGMVTNVFISDFMTDNGPDLRVYLSKDKTNAEFIDLGALKGTSGDFFYEVENNTDFETFNKVLIWCEDFSVLFGHASLTQP